ncbi:MAG: type II toxin-antitoxin system RelE/ParE family toxin [Planctomycetota bacterium]
MDFRVELTPKALNDINSICCDLKEIGSFEIAQNWYHAITDEIQSLSTFPKAHPLAPEGEAFDVEVRQKLYGNRRSAYRILFQIVPDESDSVVFILRVLHSARRHLRFDELNVN